MTVTIQNLTMRYGDHVAVSDVSLEVEAGEFVALVGPSGCGKTSMLRCIAGLQTPSAGTIVIDGKVVFDGASGIDAPPHRRDLGFVFQSYAIWPHKTVRENVAFPLRVRRRPKAEIDEAVDRVLGIVGLQGMQDKGASFLSGGQMQRVALARSIVFEPTVLLMDEPLSNLDAQLRDVLRLELKEIQQRLGVTSIYVTHDQSEALALADRVVVMREGRVIQSGAPNSVYYRPGDAFVAGFFGMRNVYRCAAAWDGRRTRVDVEGCAHTSLVATDKPPSGAARVGIRPECVRLLPLDGQVGDAVNVLKARVLVASFQGTHTEYSLRSSDGLALYATALGRSAIFPPGTDVLVEIAPEDILLLGEAG